MQQAPTSSLDYASAAPLKSPEADRIASIDVLRGLAVLGILWMNIQSFAMVEAAYASYAVGVASMNDLVVTFLGQVFFYGKFIAIFSMLFGAGIVLMNPPGKSDPDETGFARHLRRMLMLAAMGLAHGFLLWYGDILLNYALCGLLVYVLRNLPPAALCILAFGLIGASVLVDWWIDVTFDRWSADWQYFYFNCFPDSSHVDEISAYQGDWHDQMRHRGPLFIEGLLMLLIHGGFLETCGLMLAGMALLKTGVLSAQRSSATYGVMIAIGLLAILVTGWIQPLIVNGQAPYAPTPGWIHSLTWLIAPLASLAWIGVVMLWMKTGKAGRLQSALAAVGRMALTNYLLQTVICMQIFYGHGLGWFELVSKTGQLVIVAGIWALQLVLSPLWLRYFQFGPVEWVWRMVTRWQILPIIRPRIY